MAAGSMGTAKSERKSIAPGTPPNPPRRAMVRLVPAAGLKGPRVFVGAGEEVEVTGALTAAMAHALWQVRGGADIANWVDAEGLLTDLLARAEAARPEPAPAEVVLSGKRSAARR